MLLKLYKNNFSLFLTKYRFITELFIFTSIFFLFFASALSITMDSFRILPCLSQINNQTLGNWLKWSDIFYSTNLCSIFCTFLNQSQTPSFVSASFFFFKCKNSGLVKKRLKLYSSICCNCVHLCVIDIFFAIHWWQST